LSSTITRGCCHVVDARNLSGLLSVIPPKP
jgi:hypothetical protein